MRIIQKHKTRWLFALKQDAPMGKEVLSTLLPCRAVSRARAATKLLQAGAEFMESENNLGWKSLLRPWNPILTPLPNPSQNHVHRCHIYTSFEQFQPVPIPECLFSTEISSHIQSNPSWHSFLEDGRRICLPGTHTARTM